MSQIFVVCGPPTLESAGIPGFPKASFQDYPSAFTYAESIFTKTFSMYSSAKDLIFMVPYSPTPVATAVTTAATPAPTT